MLQGRRIESVCHMKRYNVCRSKKQQQKTLSYLSAHMVNRLLRENRKSIPNFFNDKKLFKNVTLQI